MFSKSTKKLQSKKSAQIVQVFHAAETRNACVNQRGNMHGKQEIIPNLNTCRASAIAITQASHSAIHKDTLLILNFCWCIQLTRSGAIEHDIGAQAHSTIKVGPLCRRCSPYCAGANVI